MPKETIIKKETLIPIGFVAMFLPAIIVACSYLNNYVIQSDVQAAEFKNHSSSIKELKLEIENHEQWSRSNMLAIAKALARIEGKLDTQK